MSIRSVERQGRRFGAVVLSLASLGIVAWSLPANAAEADFLDPDQAFELTASPASDKSVALDFRIAPGYYLYREQFRVEADGARLAPPVVPPGHSKFDVTFQKTVETYRDAVRIIVPVEQAASTFRLTVSNQGCADRGLCYPPQHRQVQVGLTGFGGDGRATLLRGEGADSGVSARSSVASPSSSDARIDRALQGGRFWTVAGVFFLAGVLLSLTPCVLPMLPILSSIIVGQGTAVSRRRGFALAVAYALGMALVYTAFGVAAGLAGEGLNAALQKPPVLLAFGAALVVLALSMFGVYEFQLPSAWTGGLSTASQRLPAGRFIGVFAMGGVSALLVSPCVAAPLAGALVYLGQTRDVVLGGSALFALAAGMSVPLLLVGASAGALLPRAGAWMDDVKRFFGWLLLGVALWTVQSLLRPPWVLAGWAVIALGAAATLGFAIGRVPTTRVGGLRRIAAALLAVAGLVEAGGAVFGGSDPLAPWQAFPLGAASEAASGLPFAAIRSIDELDAALRQADRPVMLDFYADWCVSCKEMERFTFVDPQVRRRAEGALLLRADVTANNELDRALLKRFQLFGPPGTLFFDRRGQEIAEARVIGYQDAKRFGQTLDRAGL